MEKTTLRGRRFPSSSFFHGQGGGASGFPSSPPSLVLDQREGRLEARLLGAAVGVLAGRQVEAVRVLLELLGRLGRGVGEPFEFLRSNFCVRFISVFEGAGRGRLDVSARGFVRGGFFVSGVKRTVSRRLRAELWTGGRPRRAGPGTRPPPPARLEKSQGAGTRPPPLHVRRKAKGPDGATLPSSTAGARASLPSSPDRARPPLCRALSLSLAPLQPGKAPPRSTHSVCAHAISALYSPAHSAFFFAPAMHPSNAERASAHAVNMWYAIACSSGVRSSVDGAMAEVVRLFAEEEEEGFGLATEIRVSVGRSLEDG